VTPPNSSARWESLKEALRNRDFFKWAVRNAPGRRARWGNLRRREPLSETFGWDRGTPIDRQYIEQFLSSHRDDIDGRVLEVKDPRYTERFGSGNGIISTIVDIDADNPQAAIIADLCEPGCLPVEAFDCFILVQTVHLLADPFTAVDNAWNSLAPGGVLLITVPTVSRSSRAYPDYWRWTAEGLQTFLGARMPGANIEVEGYGSLVTCIAFLLGLATKELRADELDARDKAFTLLASARVQKPPRAAAV
jgi:SAM-dependent methyltransferase